MTRKAFLRNAAGIIPQCRPRFMVSLPICDEVMSTNWADYLNLVYSVPFWEAMSWLLSKCPCKAEFELLRCNFSVSKLERCG